MKKLILASLFIAPSAFAAELHCGASVESVPGSNVYDKTIFWEKITDQKPTLRFLLPDGSVIRADEMNAETQAKITDGSKAIAISFSEGRPSLFLAKVKRKDGAINYENMAVAMSLEGRKVFLMSNEISLSCMEY